MNTLPDSFVEQIRSLLGSDEGDKLLAAIREGKPPVSVRLNPRKPSEVFRDEAEARVPWCDTGLYLAERPRFTFDPLLHAGAYYVQEAASMFIAQAYRRIAQDFVPTRLLDLCAAPGGKSTLWRSLLPDGSLLVANEPVGKRAQILAENLTKWGHPDVVCTRAFPAEFAPLEGFFDVIAADVPCSGEGMFRKDAAAIDEWDAAAPACCAERQMEIIADVWPALRPGGYLVYSTCTFNLAENEENVLKIADTLGADVVALPTEPEWHIGADNSGRGLPVCHFYPHTTRGEGLFMALLKKTSGTPSAAHRRDKRKHAASAFRQQKGDERLTGQYLKHPDFFTALRAVDDQIVALRTALADDIARVCDRVHALTAGIALVELKGKKLIPRHALALSVERRDDAFPTVELTLDDALRYLRREALTLAPEVPRGYVVATYCGHALGLLNNLGARANNLYPAEWRIRAAE